MHFETLETDWSIQQQKGKWDIPIKLLLLSPQKGEGRQNRVAETNTRKMWKLKPNYLNS